MRLKFKKYIFLLNDITNLLLKKERVQAEEDAKKLRLALIAVSAALVLSMILNVYFIFEIKL